VKGYVPCGYETTSCGNLYALLVERSAQLISKAGLIGLIVPLSLVCTGRTGAVRSFVRDRGSWVASFDMRPSSLFEGVAQRLCIFLNANVPKPDSQLFTGGYRRWAGAERSPLLALTQFRAAAPADPGAVIPKFVSARESSVLTKIRGLSLESFVQQNAQQIYVHRIVRYFVKALNFVINDFSSSWRFAL
jgi:hypothetical protein